MVNHLKAMFQLLMSKKKSVQLLKQDKNQEEDVSMSLMDIPTQMKQDLQLSLNNLDAQNLFSSLQQMQLQLDRDGLQRMTLIQLKSQKTNLR